MWMSNNLEYRGIKEVLDTIDSCSRKLSSSDPTVEEVNTEWKRLASFMSGQK